VSGLMFSKHYKSTGISLLRRISFTAIRIQITESLSSPAFSGCFYHIFGVKSFGPYWELLIS